MDQRIGVEIIQRALKSPLHTIATNAGAEGAVVCGELTKPDTPVETGYNAQDDIYCNMFEAGIVDAASVAGLLTTSEAMIVDKPDEGGAGGMPGGMPPGGMGGMPGMM